VIVPDWSARACADARVRHLAARPPFWSRAVTAAVGKLGGNVLSSQVDLAGTLSKEEFVSLVASRGLDQPALQQLLYNLAAGMPFLFVDQLVVQAPEGGTGAEGTGGRMRVMLGVLGQWQGAK